MMADRAGRIVVGFLLAVLAPLAALAQVDVDAYVENDRFTDIKLSPTGEYYAATVPFNDQNGLVVIDLKDGALKATFRFQKGTYVHNFWWVNDERVLISIADGFGTRDAPQPTGELYGMNADGSKRVMLAGWRSGEGAPGGKEMVAVSLIDMLPGNDREVLVSVRPFTPTPSTWVDRMDVYTGRRVRVSGAPVGRATFVADNRGEVRFAVGSGVDAFSKLYYRPDATAKWVLLNDQESSGRVEWPLGFSEDDSVAYLQVEQQEGPDAIVGMRVDTGERVALLRDAVVDPHPVFRNGWGAPIGVRFRGAKPLMAFFDEGDMDAKMFRSLEQAFPDSRIDIDSATRDGKRKLVFVQSDRSSGNFYIFDTETMQAERLMRRHRRLDPEGMARMLPVSLPARDGLRLHGFVTRPAVADEGKPVPMVVVPHGGPYGIFDTGEFDGETQLLTEAGYAVLRVNFRGSGNYGRAFSRAGARQWGRKMQDDLTDATRWAVEQGIADAARICIYGASYGAYAALMGVVREPGLYRCAAGYVGVYDLPRMRSTDRLSGRWAKAWTDGWIGDDAAELAAVSPNRLADRIKAPVFLAAGGEDEIAPISHSKSMEKALRDARVPVETLYYANEGHGFYTQEHRREFYVRLLDFLGQHLGGRRAAAR